MGFGKADPSRLVLHRFPHKGETRRESWCKTVTVEDETKTDCVGIEG